MEDKNHPLLNKSNWASKTWVIPLRVTVMVDDPGKYDVEMDRLVKNVINELRSITTKFDRGRMQLTIDAGTPVKDPKVWDTISNPVAQASQIEDMISKALDKRKDDKDGKDESS